jgi:DnaJ domain
MSVNMTPIDRANSRADAAALLDVPVNATRSEICRAWKKRAFELHPDRGQGSDDEFAELQNAYRYLLEIAETVSPVQPQRPSRPVMASRIERVGDAARAHCQQHLDELGLQGLVPVSVRRSGRRVSYLVDGPMSAGVNRVSVSAGELIDRRTARPLLVEVDAPSEGAGTVDLSDEVRLDLFPGARSVRLHFAGATA